MRQLSDENQTTKRLLNYAEKSCPFCQGKAVVKAGQRLKREGRVQKYYCKNCKKYFCSSSLPHKTYPPQVILNGITFYNLGYKLDVAHKKLGSQFKQSVPKSTFHSWIKQYEDICTFTKYRRKFSFTPKEIIKEKVFQHHQEYAFKMHRLKINILAKKFPEVRKYLWRIQQNCPNEIFAQGLRCSDFIIPDIYLKRIKTKNNNAVALTKLALLLAKRNKDRHSVVQDFMLINDTATIATEVPVYLQAADIPQLNLNQPISGHIDILQIRWDKIWILDYKPEAKYNRVNSAHQVFLYKLALSKRTGIPLNNICCAYFDEKDYFEVRNEARQPGLE